MTKLHIFHGTEGPSFDPYAYTEITVERFGHVVCLHCGLAEWIEIDGERTEVPDLSLTDMVVRFKELTGFEPYEWEKFHNRLESRRLHDDGYYGLHSYV